MAYRSQNQWTVARTDSDLSGRTAIHERATLAAPDPQAILYAQYLAQSQASAHSQAPAHPQTPQRKQNRPGVEIPFYPPHRQIPRQHDLIERPHRRNSLYEEFNQHPIQQAPSSDYRGTTFTEQERDQSLALAEQWWTADPRAAQMKAVMDLPNPFSSLTQTPEEQKIRQTTTELFAPLIVNLQSYLQAPSAYNGSHFSYWGAVPEWCIDTSGGSNSFFGEDWGAPPPRVGRDPRFRPLTGYGMPYEDRRYVAVKRGFWLNH